MTISLFMLTGVVVGLQLQVHVYECNSLPPEEGWILIQNFCEAEEYIDDGRLVQPSELCPGTDPPGGQALEYRHYIDLPSETPAFFAEWKVESTGIEEELEFVVPAAFVIWSGTIPGHHFTIVRDRVMYIRDNLHVPALFFDITKGVPHTYRVEQFSDESYTVYIDGQVVDSGIPFGNLFWPEPLVQFRAKSMLVPSVTTWYFMRWGVIPEDHSGDFDSDGQVDEFDVSYIAECIDRSAAGEPAEPSCSWCDTNIDNTVDCSDWEIIQESLWTGTSEPPPIYACVGSIPATSNWGVAILALLTATAGTLFFRRYATHG